MKKITDSYTLCAQTLKEVCGSPPPKKKIKKNPCRQIDLANILMSEENFSYGRNLKINTEELKNTDRYKCRKVSCE